MRSVIYFSDAPYYGGAEKYLLLLAKNIERYGYKPYLVVSSRDRLRELVGELESCGIEVFDLDPEKHGLSGAFRLLEIFKSTRSDILHINLPGPYNAHYSLVAPLARIAGIGKVVSTEHLPMVKPFLKGKLLKCIGSLFVDRVITVSLDNVKHLTRNHGIKKGKIRVVYLGIPDMKVERGNAKRKMGFDEGEALIAVIGSIEERKGQHVAVRVIKELPGNHHLLIAGRGPMEDELRSMVRTLGVVDRVHFLGKVDDVPAVLAATDVLLLTSFVEATPYVVIEAMAASLPVVASDVYGLREIVEDGVTGLLVPPGDVGKTVEAIVSITSDQSKKDRMSVAARESFVSRFGLERFVAETAALYDEVLGV